jgi:hypothetical protein
MAMKIRTQLDAAGQIAWVSDGGTPMNQNEALKVKTSLKGGIGNPDVRGLKVRTALKAGIRAGIQDSED